MFAAVRRLDVGHLDVGHLGKGIGICPQRPAARSSRVPHSIHHGRRVVVLVLCGGCQRVPIHTSIGKTAFQAILKEQSRLLMLLLM